MLLAERPEFREARPQALFMYLNFIRHWRHPVRDGLGQLRDAVEEALDQGDQEYAGFLVAVLLSQSFWVGRPIAEIDALAQSLIPHIRSQPVPSALCQALQQICLNLMGRSAESLPHRRRERLRRARRAAGGPPRGRRGGPGRGGGHQAGPALLVRRLRRRGRRHGRRRSSTSAVWPAPRSRNSSTCSAPSA